MNRLNGDAVALLNGRVKRVKAKPARRGSRKAMKYARGLAAGVGSVGVGVLGLSVVHCPESIELLTGSHWALVWLTGRGHRRGNGCVGASGSGIARHPLATEGKVVGAGLHRGRGAVVRVTQRVCVRSARAGRDGMGRVVAGAALTVSFALIMIPIRFCTNGSGPPYCAELHTDYYLFALSAKSYGQATSLSRRRSRRWNLRVSRWVLAVV
jgi:hypothetical protein